MMVLQYFWVEQACREIAKSRNLLQAADSEADVKELVQEYLSSDKAGKWLLVVDNLLPKNAQAGDSVVLL